MSNQLTNEQRHGILQQLLQYMKNKEKLESIIINKVVNKDNDKNIIVAGSTDDCYIQFK